MADWVYSPFEKAQLKNLRKYIEAKGFKPAQRTECEFVMSALSWVTSQWAHDGFNAPPKSFHALNILKAVHKKKERFRCVEYGGVLAEVLQSYGFITRALFLRSNDVAYGGFGQGHVAMEVWLNDLQKWIFVDPQFGVYLVGGSRKVPLNYYEIYQEKKAGRFAKLQVKVAPGCAGVVANKSYKDGYKKFLKEYFGHICVNNSEIKVSASLLLESVTTPVTFQGLRLDNGLYTSRAELFYPQMNRVAILLSYKEAGNGVGKSFKELGIKTDQDYLQKMAMFAVKPEFNVQLKSGSKIKERYQYRTSAKGQWIRIVGNTFEWSAFKETNDLEVRAVNEFGRPGPTTFMKLAYK
ncbi:MAG: transglutaminase domain-containing protein [Bdellovibrio sp.]|nr:transglutaminase domain-containing protein [Bdellovibrio sp.]